jgi:hypothetical protein
MERAIQVFSPGRLGIGHLNDLMSALEDVIADQHAKIALIFDDQGP